MINRAKANGTPRSRRTAICVFALTVVLAVCLAGSKGRADDVITAQGVDEGRDTVVLLHGLGRRKSAMRRLASRLEAAGYRVERVGYKSLNQSPDENLANISEQISACCLNGPGYLHFVGHSLGGLMIIL